MTTDERIDAIAMNLELLGYRVESLAGLIEEDSKNIRALARIAEIHERRLTDLESGPA